MIIDTNVSFGLWPFERFLQNTAGRLNTHLQTEGISTALVSSIEGILYRNPDVYNKILIEKIKKYPSLKPVMIINPLLADWKQRLYEYSRLVKVTAVKIFPVYHSYSLLAEHIDVFMDEILNLNIIVMVQVRIEDERTQLPSMRVNSLNADDIIRFAQKHPVNKIICLCLDYGEAVKILKATENVFADISYMDGVNVLPRLLQQVSAERVLFGSHTPFLYTASARMKMMYEEISPQERKKICSGNISTLMATDFLGDEKNLVKP